MITSIVRSINIILAGILAGVSFGIWIGFNPSDLSVQAYIEQQQNMLQSLRTFLVALVIFTTLVTILSAFLQRTDKPVFVSLLIAAGFLIACILITRFGNKPIDDLVLTWTKDSFPAGWIELRDKWWSFHLLRTVVEILAFLIITWSGIKNENSKSAPPVVSV